MRWFPKDIAASVLQDYLRGSIVTATNRRLWSRVIYFNPASLLKWGARILKPRKKTKVLTSCIQFVVGRLVGQVTIKTSWMAFSWMCLSEGFESRWDVGGALWLLLDDDDHHRDKEHFFPRRVKSRFLASIACPLSSGRLQQISFMSLPHSGGFKIQSLWTMHVEHYSTTRLTRPISVNQPSSSLSPLLVVPPDKLSVHENIGSTWHIVTSLKRSLINCKHLYAALRFGRDHLVKLGSKCRFTKAAHRHLSWVEE